MADAPPSSMGESLVKRLAGPSTGKAGLAKDQTEINRIIAEASKGSKFYENEKQKDKELTERISRLLKHRDEVSKGVDVARLEANVDKMLVELEAQRDLTQYIVHVDMDAFFAAVELLDNPSLKGKPFGVGRGVLTTASYEARMYGARSGMPGFIAKKLCPQIILVPIRPERYGEMSSKVMAVFRRFDANMMVAGADEAYLNITQYCQANGISPDECVRQLRTEVQAETTLTVSAGIAPNKMLAKICSDKNKPNGQFHLPFECNAIIEFMRFLPIRKIQGIGRVSERLLDSIGIKKCGDIYTHRATLCLLDKQFGLRSLLLTHLGIASNVVQPGQREARKSVGSERTFDPMSDKRSILSKLEKIAAELEEDMKRTGWAGKTVTLKYKLDTYKVFSRAKSAPRYINRKEELFAIGKELLMPELPLTIRLIGLRVTKLKDLRAPEDQGLKRFFESAGESPSKKRQKIIHTVDDEMEESDSDCTVEEDVMDGYEDDMDRTVIVDDSTADDKGSDDDDMDLASGLPLGKPSSSRLEPRPDVSRLKPVSRAVKPASTSASSAEQVASAISTTSSSSTSISKLGSRTIASLQNRAPPVEEQICPVCSKVIETDNAGLNEHIDFCLSKGAILAATVSPKKPPLSRGNRRPVVE